MRIVVFICAILWSGLTYAQSVGINETGAKPNTKSILDVSSSDKGILIPRLTTEEREDMDLSITEEGMLVYDQTTQSFWVFNGSEWDAISQASGDTDWVKEGTTSTAGINTDDVYHLGNVAIGKTLADHVLDIEGGDGKNINLRINTNVEDVADRTYGTSMDITSLGDGSVYASEIILKGTSGGERRGYHTNISGSSSQSTGHVGFSSFINSSHPGANYGISNFVTNQGAGAAYGSRINIGPEGTGSKYGSLTSIASNNSSRSWGNINKITTSSTNQTYGTYNELKVNEFASVSGIYNDLQAPNGAFLISSYNDVINGGNGISIGNFNELNGTTNGFQYAARNHVVVVGSGEHIGSYQYITGEGAGLRYGIVNEMQLKEDNLFPSGAINKISGVNNSIVSGYENDIDVDGTGDRYGLFSKLGSKGSGKKYGTYTQIDEGSSGEKYGHYIDINSSTNTPSYGNYSRLNSSSGEIFGTFMVIEASSSNKGHYGDYKFMQSSTSNILTGLSNQINSTGVTGFGIGLTNFFNGQGGSGATGVQNSFVGESSTGITGVSNSITDSGNANIYGVYNLINAPGQGFKYGSYNKIISTTTNSSSDVYGTTNLIEGTATSDMYGTYNVITNSGSGNHYAGYFSATGDTNDFAAVFEEGNVVVNESGGDYDFKVESMNITHAIYVDASKDAVGIGQSTPEHMLHVYDVKDDHIAMIQNFNGTTEADGLAIKIAAGFDNDLATSNQFIKFMDGLGNVKGSISGDGAGGVSFNETSDERLKQNIALYTSGLATLSQINPYSYQMKSAPEIEKVGFLAQELYETFPIAVSGTPDNTLDNPMMVDYSKFTPLLVAAVKEQNTIIKNQEEKINDLEARLQKLEALVTSMSTKE